MAKIKGFLNKSAHEPIFHKTSIGRRPSLQKMNKHKREASRPPISANVSYKCIKSKAELEVNIDGSKSIKALILE